jgi:hypothetical protein
LEGVLNLGPATGSHSSGEGLELEDREVILGTKVNVATAVPTLAVDSLRAGV